MPIYQAYAPIYDAIGQGQFSARMATWALAWLAERGLHRPARVLDLACGTGEAALVFVAAGCDVIGLDQSVAMLDIACGKARDAGYDITFLHGDMCELPIDDGRPTTQGQESYDGRSSFVVRRSSFDLVTCFYDSINYLTGDGDLDRVCIQAACALRPGGHLIFDINTAAEYATWDERDSVTYDGRDCMVYNRLSYDPNVHLATGRIVWFVRELDRWWRGQETHIERAWSEDAVLAALASAGLALVGRYDSKGAAATEGALRVVYVARQIDGAEHGEREIRL